MKPSFLVSLLSFALVLPASSRILVPTTSNARSHHFITLSQTGGDPEPINPPGGGNGGSN